MKSGRRCRTRAESRRSTSRGNCSTRPFSLAIKKQDYPRAFAMSERARARTLAEKSRAPAGVTLAGIETIACSRARPVVALNQFDDELAVWVIRPGQHRP